MIHREVYMRINNLADLSVLIEQTRRFKGYTQIELAQKADVSRSFVARVEAKELPNPGFSNLLQIFAVLGITLESSENESEVEFNMDADSFLSLIKRLNHDK
jgi:transcriptional regulator with XRE-family HTH domain